MTLGLLLSVPTNLGYIALAALIAGETMGVPLPGETALIAGGVLASEGHLEIELVILIAAGAAIVGDNVGFWIGRRGGRAQGRGRGRARPGGGRAGGLRAVALATRPGPPLAWLPLHDPISYFQAVVLGLVQGAAEPFPISSLGHGVILPRLLHWDIHQ